MPAYLIAHRREITDPQNLKSYEAVDATIAKFKGKVVVRADRYDVLEGHWHSGSDSDDSRPQRMTVIEFPDMKHLREWYGSPDYAALKKLRQHSADADMIAVEGKSL